MKFELIHPWDEWKIVTDFGKRTTHAKLDTGSPMTLIGVNYAEQLGITRDFIAKQTCVSFRGVSGKLEGYAFQVPCTLLPLGDEKLPVSFVYVPYEYAVENIEKDGKVVEKKIKYRFVTTDKYLIGTDVIDNYNVQVAFKCALRGKTVTSAQLELTPHGLRLPKRTIRTYSLSKLAPQVDEITTLFNFEISHDSISSQE